MRTRYLVLIALLMPGFALADDWDDFTNNLATDLVPRIELSVPYKHANPY
jgi:hypothetical protein